LSIAKITLPLRRCVNYQRNRNNQRKSKSRTKNSRCKRAIASALVVIVT